MSAGRLALDSTPPVPPDTYSQMGAGPESPYAGIGNLAKGQSDQDDGFSSIEKAHPQGALIVKVNAVKKVLEEIAQMGQKIAPFAKQASEALQSGLSAELQGAQPGIVGGSGSQPPGSQGTQSPSQDYKSWLLLART